MLPLTGYALSPDQITDLVNRVYPNVHEAPRYQLLDSAFNPVGVPGSDNPADFSDISQWVQTATITNDTTQTVHRSLDITMRQIPGLTLNPRSHVIRVFWDYFDANGDLMLEVPLGTFPMVTPDRDFQDSGNIITIACLDPSMWLAQLYITLTYTVAAGYNYTQAVKDFLTADKTPLSQGGTGQTPAGADFAGPGIPAANIAITPSTLTTPTTIPFVWGNNLLSDAVNAGLLAPINYYPLWFNALGLPRSSPRPYYTQVTPSIGWVYVTSNTASVLKPPVKQRIANAEQAGNVAAFKCENAGAPPLYSVQYNRSAASSISIQNVGRNIMLPPVQQDSAPDQASLDLAAKLALTEAAMADEELSFTTVINPFHESHDYLSMTITAADGSTEISTPGSYGFEEDYWQMDLNAREMTHRGRRAVAV